MAGTGTAPPPLITDVPTPDPEVLIREARRRTRRRRAGYGLGLILATGAALVVVLVARSGAAAVPKVTPRSPLTVDAKAFKGHGVLAFVSKGSLYVLRGADGRVVHLPDKGFTASDPTVSPDGKWVAYVETATRTLMYQGDVEIGTVNLSQVWIARANGSDSHELKTLSYGQIVGWSPNRDVLAVIDEPRSVNLNGTQPLKCGSKPTTSVRLVTPPEAIRTVYSQPATACHDPEQLYGAVWSPTGGSIAIATTNFRSGSRVFAINLRTGARTTWFAIAAKQTLPHICTGCGGRDVIAQLAGWWPKWGIAFSVFSSGMTRNNDGSPLEVVRSPGAAPTEIGTTLSSGTDTEFAPSRAGRLAIVYAPGRQVSYDTEVQTCSLSAMRCAPVPDASVWTKPVSYSCFSYGSAPDAPVRVTACSRATYRPSSFGTGVSLDPAWSPSGSLLAYVRAPVALSNSVTPASWLNHHELYIYDPSTGRSRAVPGTAGVAAPQWSADGRSILYVSHDSLWLLNVRSRRSVRLAGPLFAGSSFATAYPSYYFQVPFDAQFGWWG